MNLTTVLLSVLLVAATGVCVFIAWALWDLVGTSRSLRATSEETRSRLLPLLEKADVTVDAINAELLRIDTIITQFEDTSSRVSTASATITDIVNAPAGLVSEAATRVRRAWKERHKQPEERPAVAPKDSPEETAEKPGDTT